MISPLVRSQKYWLNNLGSGWLNMIDPFSLVLAWQKAWCSVESIHRGALRTSWYLLRHMPIQLHWLYIHMNSWKHICTYCYIHQPLDSLDVHKTYTSIHHLYIIYTSSIHHLYIIYTSSIHIYTIWLNENDLPATSQKRLPYIARRWVRPHRSSRPNWRLPNGVV